jgi:hypothetical protein
LKEYDPQILDWHAKIVMHLMTCLKDHFYQDTEDNMSCMSDSHKSLINLAKRYFPYMKKLIFMDHKKLFFPVGDSNFVTEFMNFISSVASRPKPDEATSYALHCQLILTRELSFFIDDNDVYKKKALFGHYDECRNFMQSPYAQVFTNSPNN